MMMPMEQICFSVVCAPRQDGRTTRERWPTAEDRESWRAQREAMSSSGCVSADDDDVYIHELYC